MNAWDVFRRAPSRGGRGRRAAVDSVVCFGWGGFFCLDFFSICFFFKRTRPAASMTSPCLIYLSTSTIVEHFGDTFFLPQFRRIMVLQVQGSGYGLG